MRSGRIAGTSAALSDFYDFLKGPHLMDPVTASLMAIGSGSAAGMRPYFTVFGLGFAALAVPEGAPSVIATAVDQIPDSIANPWVLVICAILALAEFVGGKVPAVDLVLESFSLWLRPVLGTLVGMQLGVDSGAAAATLTTVLGAGTSLPVSLGKTSATAATTTASAGTADWIRSLLEDSSALILVIAAVLLPILAAFLGLVAVGVGITLFFMFRKAYRAMKLKFSDMKQWQAEVRAQRRAQIASGERVSTLQALKRLAAGATPAMATGVTASTGAMRTGATAATAWTRNTATATAQASFSGFHRAAGATGTAFQAAKERMGPGQTTNLNSTPPPDNAPTPHPGHPARPPYPPTPPPMPPQNAPDTRNTTAQDAAPTRRPPTPETDAWGVPPVAPGTPTPQKPLWAPQHGQPVPPEKGRAQAAGERAGHAVASAKGQVNKLRGQFGNFRNGFAKSETDTPEGDETPPQSR